MAPSEQELANKEWAQARFKELDRDVMEIKSRIGQWEKWWRGIMIAVIGGILSIAIVGWALTERVTKIESGLDGVDSQVNTLSDTVDEVVDTQKEIKAKIEDRERKDRRGDADLDEIKTLLKDLASSQRSRRR